MKYSETSIVTSSPRSRKNFQAAPVLTTPWIASSGSPARSLLIRAADHRRDALAQSGPDQVVLGLDDCGRRAPGGCAGSGLDPG